MSLLPRIIFTGFAPNITPADIVTVLSYMVLPWRWVHIRTGVYTARAHTALAQYLGVPYVYVCDSGRSALYIALQALGVGKGDAVLVQAYTCVVVINAITQLGATPIYVDINTDYNMDPVDADKKITLPHVKALIIQHTFGVPADIDTLIALARTHGVPTIEDAAHALGARYKGQLVGTYADIGMYSFGSDKIISCVRGGALSTADAALATRIASVQQALPQPSLLHTLRHLLHIPVFAVGKALYGIGVGKWLLALTKRLHIVNKIVYPAEKRGGFAPSYPSRLANSLAHILTMQLADLDARNAHRMRIAQQYSAGIHNPRTDYTRPTSSWTPTRTVIVERQVTSSGGTDAYFWLWLMEHNQNQRQRDDWIYHNRDRVSQEQMDELRRRDSGIDARLRKLEEGGVQRDPNFRIPDSDYKDKTVTAPADKPATSSGFKSFWLTIGCLLLFGALIYLVFFKRFNTRRSYA